MGWLTRQLLLSNLSTFTEGRLAIVREGGITVIVEVVESGSRRGKENAASVLLQLSLIVSSSVPWFCKKVLCHPLLHCLSLAPLELRKRYNSFLVTFAIKDKVSRGRARHEDCPIVSYFFLFLIFGYI